MTRRQCKQCPWKIGSNPRDIPGEYSEEKHRALESTIASPADIDVTIRKMTRGGPVIAARAPMRMMACHETMLGKELPCVGWLAHQLGSGNNLLLRLAVMSGQVDADVEVDGPQHERFEDTLP